MMIQQQQQHRTMYTFSEELFKQRVNKAIEQVKTILDNTRTPAYPSEIQHKYEDKYELAEFLGITTIAAINNVFDYFKLSSKTISEISGKNKSVTLRLKAEEECKFVKKETKEVQSDTKDVTKAGIFGKVESYTVTKVTEYFWEFSIKWDLLVYLGVDSDKGTVLQSYKRNTELITNTEATPKPANVIRPPIDVNITWLIEHLDENRTPVFSINRENKLCRTPRRNPEVLDMLTFLRCFHIWTTQVHNYFYNNVFAIQKNHGLDLSSINDTGVFVPVLPLFDSSSISSSKIPPLFINSFISEQARSLEAKQKEITKVFSSSNNDLIQLQEVMLLVVLLHTKQICESFSEGVDYIENILYKQLFSALGKHVSPTDFSNYMTFHNRKIFKEQYRPQPFSHAIRRPDHYPEGVLSIEDKLEGETNTNPITTIVAQHKATQPMYFALDSSTKVPFFGDRYLHGFVSNQFSGSNPTNLSLHARARQFSSFILIVGRIVSADLFDPKHAIVVQNNDHFKIPLILETIPTAKEFKEAISSLSPEQQRFCKAFRSMQLESTLFGVLVIQIKPQLEKLLKLPDDSLTKEIQLSQDLLNLFIKYQIPSDLVSYDGPADFVCSTENKIEKVKQYVARMNEMVAGAQKQELELAQQEQQFRLAERDRNSRASVSESESDGGEMYYDECEKEMCYDEEEECDDDDNDYGEGGSGAVLFSVAPSSSFYNAKGAPAPVPAPPPVSAPAPVPQNNNQPQEQKDLADTVMQEVVQSEAIDYTKIPKEMDKLFEKFDDSNALRPTIINISPVWEKNFQKSLLSAPETTTVDTDEQEKEKNKAFDLLDALTKSGVLSVDNASLHVVIAATHCFDKNIVDTLIQQNINPVEKFENSTLIVASTIHQTPPAQLIAPEQLERIQSVSTSTLLLEN